MTMIEEAIGEISGSCIIEINLINYHWPQDIGNLPSFDQTASRVSPTRGFVLVMFGKNPKALTFYPVGPLVWSRRCCDKMPEYNTPEYI